MAKVISGDVVGFVVKIKNAEHPHGAIVSRVYHARSAADDLAAYLQKRAPDGTKYWTTEKVSRFA